ncbi:GNAT family N-acetyltransferase [Actinoplanes sp. G11-F43]|uniref:GNAT family N-acetyltransferase n=1 Tax=Actinoplanes sp. G11-F43 TaxID=3424130 RepID=UPI003D32557D
MTIRRALPGDAAELVRLRGIMLSTLSPRDWNEDWREPAGRSLARRLSTAEPDHADLAAFVAERPDGSGLASCAVGVIEERLGNPHNADGRVGYIFNVCTEPDMRRRGYSRSCMTALLQWFRDRDVRAADLRASPHGEPLYTSLGFVRTSDPTMRLRP